MGALRTTAGRVAVLLLVPLGTAGPAASEPVQEAVLLDGINPFILTNVVSRRIVVEIDWVAGTPPTPEAVQAVEDVLRQHCPVDKQVDVRVDDEIALEQWTAAGDRPGLERLVARFLDHDPSRWREAEVVYVLYAPDSQPWYGKTVSGMTDWVVFDHAGEARTVRTLMLFTGKIRRDAWLWITPPKVERATLVHEMGHVLGLVGNPLHTQSRHPGHCTRSRCVMNQPGTRSLLVNALPAFFAGHVPHRFGRRCLEDIQAAKSLWAAHESSAEVFAERLRAERAEREASIFARWRVERERP